MVPLGPPEETVYVGEQGSSDGELRACLNLSAVCWPSEPFGDQGVHCGPCSHWGPLASLLLLPDAEWGWNGS